MAVAPLEMVPEQMGYRMSDRHTTSKQKTILPAKVRFPFLAEIANEHGKELEQDAFAALAEIDQMQDDWKSICDAAEAMPPDETTEHPGPVVAAEALADLWDVMDLSEEGRKGEVTFDADAWREILTTFWKLGGRYREELFDLGWSPPKTPDVGFDPRTGIAKEPQ